MTTPPKKDVIYIDIEDDITSVIEKVKSAEAGIVALVPPKRIGMLQSIVNLKLLKRVADGDKKRLVVITNDSALAALSAGVMIPVAKNLQSKPELAEVTALGIDGEDVIDGETVSVGDHAKLPPSQITSTDDDSIIAAAPIAAEQALQDAPRKKQTKIPNFTNFRNKTLLIAGGALLAVVFFVWAIWFAPQATVTIAAQTTPYNVSESATASEGAEFDAGEKVLPALMATQKKTNSVEFEATGKKEVGEKATGTVELSKLSPSETTIPAGSELTSENGQVFITDETATIPASQPCFPAFCAQSTTVGVTAEKSGTDYNGASGELSNVPQGASAEFTDATSGGTDKTVTVVSDADVAKARDELEKQDDDEMRDALAKEFEGKDVIIVNESFRVSTGDPSVSPAVGEEAKDVTLKVETTYKMIALERNDIQAIIDASVKKQLEGLPDQKIYEYGLDDVRFNQVTISDGGDYRLEIAATAYAGPEIDADELAKDLRGKVEGEIQEEVKQKDGVQNVEVNFWPFWVSSVSSEDKINVRFDIENAE